MSTFGLTRNLKYPDRNKQFISNIPRKLLFLPKSTPQSLYNTIVGVHSINRVS